ncbi:hypothetical protein BKA70DRAFT_1574324 [Coprinopsis sp. MPI-PUGE-AT-0042]|nr:hypothetical protein BKA70DRAFT_1574324 [Coprinopsis sp. MPI-PUGE-AT-0042]
MSPRLPNELLGAVSDCLRDPFDRPTTQALALVSPDLRRTCQKLLFENLSLTITTDVSAPIVDRLDGLATTPRLVSYTSSFRLEFKGRFEPGSNRMDWIYNHGEPLLRVLQLVPLNQLEAFGLVDWQHICVERSSESATLEFRSVCERLRDAVKPLLEAPSIRSLSITGLPIKVMQGCRPSLKHLVVSGAADRFTPFLDLRSPTRTPARVLETLESRFNRYHFEGYNGLSDPFLSFHQCLLHPTSPFSLGSLKRLVWHNWDRGLGELPLVMERCASSLKHFELLIAPFALNYEGFSEDDPPTSLIWAQDQLESLAIESYAHVQGAQALSWIYHELGRRETPYEKLATVSFTLFVTNPTQWSGFVSYGIDETWRSFGEALANLTMLPSLQSVRLHISCSRWTTTGGAAVMELVSEKERQIRTAMSTLESRGILAIEMSVKVKEDEEMVSPEVRPPALKGKSRIVRRARRIFKGIPQAVLRRCFLSRTKASTLTTSDYTPEQLGANRPWMCTLLKIDPESVVITPSRRRFALCRR